MLKPVQIKFIKTLFGMKVQLILKTSNSVHSNIKVSLIFVPFNYLNYYNRYFIKRWLCEPKMFG